MVKKNINVWSTVLRVGHPVNICLLNTKESKQHVNNDVEFGDWIFFFLSNVYLIFIFVMTPKKKWITWDYLFTCRFDNYGKQGLLCGSDGLPHLIVSGDQRHWGEFITLGILFLYIAGWIWWVGRSYLIAIRDEKKHTQK